ncbi:hypothetical protein FHR83_008044 [Actinoplanes campanulatus]|uniref:Uncharacterized protein n=1 Tax=Actinoplanes campanulatus TaxID=113559 RepID=A0A7W5APZ8_9ACTN|nr:hypothetical protein [Actinoplanes campanulatus]MBB3100322.1 hypothetical protein [Actinoplanes campanulatus]GGN43892.1 hypothetical protein GCM10010109_76480 [Actinoplanes campanulatus]GID40876.1 hypothetical protein Aca09nite_73820 [Actinoplanes campanulatus]
MDHNTEHHVPRIDDTATASTLHDRAEAVTVQDFNHPAPMITGITVGLSDRHTCERTDGTPARPAP